MQIHVKVDIYLGWEKKSQQVMGALEIYASVFWDTFRKFIRNIYKECFPLAA